MNPRNPKACWCSHPEEWQPLFDNWRKAYPKLVELYTWVQYGGLRVCGITISARGTPLARRELRLLVTVPHAHEPAGTSACVDVVAQLLTGYHLDGTPTALDRDEILNRALITILPDTNSQGRARSPVRCWDGLQYDNEAFLKIAFGIAHDGERFGRYPQWRYSEHQPQQIGIIYEQLDDELFVEPNTSRNSTHAYAIDELFNEFHYTHYIELHQHETDEAVLLPADFEDLPPMHQEQLTEWAMALIKAWRDAGAQPRPEPFIPYQGQQRQQFFKAFWEGRCEGMLRLTTEVRNNRHERSGEPTPLEHQFIMAHTALVTTITYWLGRANCA